MDSLYDKYKKQYWNAEGKFYLKHLEPYRRFIEALSNYANMVNNNVDVLLSTGNTLGVEHYKRLLADACLKAYGLLIVNDPEKKTFAQHFLKDKPTNNLKCGKTQLTTRVLREYICKDYEGVAEAYEEGCNNVHLSKYYTHNYEEDEEGGDYTRMQEEDGVTAFYNQLVLLNETLIDILHRINEEINPPFPLRWIPSIGSIAVVSGLELKITQTYPDGSADMVGELSAGMLLVYIEELEEGKARLEKLLSKKLKDYGDAASTTIRETLSFVDGYLNALLPFKRKILMMKDGMGTELWRKMPIQCLRYDRMPPDDAPAMKMEEALDTLKHHQLTKAELAEVLPEDALNKDNELDAVTRFKGSLG